MRHGNHELQKYRYFRLFNKEFRVLLVRKGSAHHRPKSSSQFSSLCCLARHNSPVQLFSPFKLPTTAMDRLSMSLDQIIAQRDKQKSPSQPSQNHSRHSNTSSSSLNIRGSRGSRTSRQMNPYQPPTKPTSRISDSAESSGRKDPAALKFLLSNYLSGIFIGNGGTSIREMEHICDASIHISNITDHYPGTKERTVYMTGSEAAITLAQSLMWEMIGQQAYADSMNNGPLLWNPSEAKESPGQYDDVTVQGRITVPAASAGSIIGRGGNFIKSLATETGVEVTLDSKEDAEFSQERVLTIAGTVAQCMNFTSRILHRLVKNNEANYVVAGTTYPKRLSNGANRSRDNADDGGHRDTFGSSVRNRSGTFNSQI